MCVLFMRDEFLPLLSLPSLFNSLLKEVEQEEDAHDPNGRARTRYQRLTRLEHLEGTAK